MGTKKSTSSSIISLSLKHLEACVELDKSALNGLWSKAQWKKELSNPRSLCLGAINSSELIGFVCALEISNELDILSIAVNPIHQKQGLGEMILRAVVSKAQFKGIKKITLEVKENNYIAISLYRKIGFKTAGKRIKYYKDGSNALILSLALAKA